MKIVSFRIKTSRELKLLLKMSKLLGLKPPHIEEGPTSPLEMVREEIRKAADDLDKDF